MDKREAVAVAPAAGIWLHVAPPSPGTIRIPNAAGAPNAPVLRPSHTHAALDVRIDLGDFVWGPRQCDIQLFFYGKDIGKIFILE